MTDLPALPWADIGATGLVIMVVLMIFTGRLIPRSTYNDVKEQRDTFRDALRESRDEMSSWEQRLDANTDALAAVKAALEEVIRKGDQQQ